MSSHIPEDSQSIRSSTFVFGPDDTPAAAHDTNKPERRDSRDTGNTNKPDLKDSSHTGDTRLSNGHPSAIQDHSRKTFSGNVTEPITARDPKRSDASMKSFVNSKMPNTARGMDNTNKHNDTDRPPTGTDKEAWPAKPVQKENSIESVGANFMRRVENIEDENNKLLDDNQRLLGKLEIADESEELIVTENQLLKQELSELTRYHQALKDENSALLSTSASYKRKMETEKSAHEKEVKELKIELAVVEKRKENLREMVDEMELTMKDFSQKMEKQDLLIKELKTEITTKKGSSNSDDEVIRLRNEVKEKDAIIRDLNDDNSKSKQSVREYEDMVLSMKSNYEESLNTTQKVTSLETENRELKENVLRKERELKRKDDAISPLEKERTFLTSEIAKLREELKQKTKDLEDSNKRRDTLLSSRKSLEKSLASLKEENARLKDNTDIQNKVVSDSSDDTIRQLREKIQTMTVTEQALSEVIKSKQNHIADLRSEIANLRKNNDMHSKEMEGMREQHSDQSVINDKYADVMDSHKRILDENKRLRSMVATKSMEEANASTERLEMSDELDKSEKKLEKAQKRIKQLERWMDEIFSNQDYEVVLKNGMSRDTPLSLPEIPLTNRTSRSYGAQTKRSPRKPPKGASTGRYPPDSVRGSYAGSF